MSTSSPLEDRAFLRAILAKPDDMTAWLVYADWLDEHDDLRGRYIRLEIQRLDPALAQTERSAVVAELATLRGKLDPNWVAIFDRPKIENCDQLFEFKCPKQWEELRGTPNPGIRHCDSCHKNVHYCRSVQEADVHAQLGLCVAVASGVERTPGDLARATRMTHTVGRLVRLQPEPTSTAAQPKPTTPQPAPPPRKPWWQFW